MIEESRGQESGARGEVRAIIPDEEAHHHADKQQQRSADNIGDKRDEDESQQRTPAEPADEAEGFQQALRAQQEGEDCQPDSHRDRLERPVRGHVADPLAHAAKGSGVERPAQHAHVTVHHRAFAVFGNALRLEEVCRHHGGDHAGNRQRHQHRGDHGQAEVLEELPGNARHQAHGQEHGHDTEGGGHHRQTDLVGGIDGCLVGALTHAHVAHDVLDLHDGIVHQHAGHQPQGQQRKRVQRKAEQVHEVEGGNGRKRNGQRRDDRGAPVAQKQEHHDNRQQRAFHQQRHRTFVLVLGVVHLGEQAGEGNAGVCFLHLFQHGDGIVVNPHVGFAARTGDREGDDLLAVHLGHRADLAVGILHAGDIGKLDRPPATQRDLRLRKLVSGLRVAQHANRLARPGDLGLAACRVHVQLAQRVVHLAGGDAQRLHAAGIEDHQDLAVHAAAPADFGQAVHRQQRLGQRIVDEPAELLQGHVVGRNAERDDGLRTGLLLEHARFENAVGQLSANVVDLALHLVHRLGDVGAEGELDAGEGIAFRRSRIDVLNAVQRLHRGFHPLRDLVLNLGRGGARLGNAHLHHRELDIRLILHVHVLEREDPGDHQPDEGQNGDDRVADRPGGKLIEVHD